MDINIIKAEKKHLIDCKVTLMKSELGTVYFEEEDKAIKTLSEGISKGEIFVAIDKGGICLGFVWFIINGAFHSFPYLHIIAVKEEFRNLGIGKKLLKHFEEVTSKNYSKLFLVVAEFNSEAKRLYQSIGYTEVGVIPNLYKTGVTEFLMMKEIYH
ncbi:GNAT family N-acetyltransferase [Clostridium estertheticum]|uniref:GNAT family N-acetyltransferase n=2 Tax=Clostridium estertheticum TaxID=238834 RepID=UPI001CF47A7A|nr:N-acetyltransferase [Clostridium estertheticum]MCB2347408.1 GNAT family N-acetyltransferase [Clostridium estertheticum]MCB2352031.1 GNAT family N-acetyltransferase [Clostridium estertheticum]